MDSAINLVLLPSVKYQLVLTGFPELYYPVMLTIPNGTKHYKAFQCFNLNITFLEQILSCGQFCSQLFCSFVEFLLVDFQYFQNKTKQHPLQRSLGRSFLYYKCNLHAITGSISSYLQAACTTVCYQIFLICPAKLLEISYRKLSDLLQIEMQPCL